MIQKTLAGARFTRILGLVVLFGLSGYQPGLAPPAAALPRQQALVTLDNVGVSVNTTFLPAPGFTTSGPGSASQVATAVSWRPFHELSITAVSFGTRPGIEAVPVAQPGGASAYADALRAVRVAQGGKIINGPTATLFGQLVTGQATVVHLNVDGPVLKPILIVEWVVEAGPRLWIIRASQEQPAESLAAPSPSALRSLSVLVLTSYTLDNPSTLRSGADSPLGTGFPSAPDAGGLPTPGWWSGDCDTNTYVAGTKGLRSYRLGAAYLGMPACGPRPFADNAPDVLVHFFPGSWGALEWECVELSLRYLFLAYGIHPYSANGNKVVWNYSSAADGGSLQKISNGTTHAAPQPGDVLSYGGTSSVGHTSVVVTSTVDSDGNGSVSVIEQNNSPNGTSTLALLKWYVQGNSGSVSGWLHNPSWLPTNKLMLPVFLQ